MREELYKAFMPDVVAENMKKPLKKLGQPTRRLRTAARMNAEFCPLLIALIAASWRRGSSAGTFRPTAKQLSVYSRMILKAIFLVAILIVSFLRKSLFSAAVNATVSNPIIENTKII